MSPLKLDNNVIHKEILGLRPAFCSLPNLQDVTTLLSLHTTAPNSVKKYKIKWICQTTLFTTSLPVSVLSAFYKSDRPQSPGLQTPAGTAVGRSKPDRGWCAWSPHFSHGSSPSPGQEATSSRAQDSEAGQDSPDFHLHPRGTLEGMDTCGRSSWCRTYRATNCVCINRLCMKEVFVWAPLL